ncbi:MAG: hypothetical protein E4H20_07620, partial [Spirochaetales bacterium]
MTIDPDWQILEGNFHGDERDDDPATLRSATFPAPESLFTLSNGYIGIRGAPEEGAPETGSPVAGSPECGTYINGYFERTPIVYGEEAFGFARWHETIVSVPDGTGFRLFLDGVPLGCVGCTVSAGRRLDLRKGLLERRAVWNTPDGKAVELRSERFVSLARPNVAALRLTFTVRGNASVRLESFLDTSTANAGAHDDPRVGAKFSGAPFGVLSSRQAGALSSATIRTRTSCLALACAIQSEAHLIRQPDRSQPQALSPESQALSPAQSNEYPAPA